MTEEQQNLKRDYQDIKAPPYLAPRIRAEVAERGTSGQRWLPAAGTATAVLAVLLLLPLLLDLPVDQPEPKTSPSLSAMARLMPDKPAVSSPGLSGLRSVRTPALPRKPKPANSKQPQSFIQPEEDQRKETDHA